MINKGFSNTNKVLKMLLIIVSTTIGLTGISYATIKIYKKLMGQTTMTPTFTGEIGKSDINSIWIGTFQLAWNEFKNNIIGLDIEFANEEESDMLKELNKNIFKQEMLSKNSYYIKIGETSNELKEEILNDINTKFGVEKSSMLNNIDFNDENNGYTIYSILFKKFEFIIPFDKLRGGKFSNYNDEVEYFGINNTSNENLSKNVEILFFNTRSDFAVKLNTKGNDEIILYKTDNNSSFNELYKEIIEKSKNFIGEKAFLKNDELKVPYINIDETINYDELCDKVIKYTNGMYISNALQNVNFTLNERGGNLTSEAGIKSEYISDQEDARYFYFDSNFVLLMKENDKEYPYLGLKIDNIDNLVCINSLSN